MAKIIDSAAARKEIKRLMSTSGRLNGAKLLMWLSANEKEGSFAEEAAETTEEDTAED